jgi:hypothetical protein
MRKTIALFVVLAIAALTTSCAQVGWQPGTRPGNVDHVVLLWMNEPGNDAVKEKMIATSRAFAREIPGIVSVSVGDAVPSDRDVVDDSFDLGIVIRFKDRAALDAYQKHPAHTKAAKEVLAPNASRLKVYDIEARM